MKAAIYVRRSTDEHQAASLEVQTSEATAYCQRKGWQISEIYTDDAVSRAEFKKRPGLLALLNAAKRGEFTHVVCRDETRIGGDMVRTGLVIQDLADAGIKLVYYFTDELVSTETAVDKFLIAARNFASELEREKISQRTHEHLLHKAKAGKPAGGIAYGYGIKTIDGTKSYVVNKEQAEIVSEIYLRYSRGEGLRSIARSLNEKGIPSPRAGKRGTGSWSPSAIRAILTNPRYVGQGRYNQTAKGYRGGTKVRDSRPLHEHVKYETPSIISDDLWAQVSERFASNQRLPTASKGRKPKYLLTGISRCAICGGPIYAGDNKINQTRVKAYICGWRRDRGTTVCSNKMRNTVDTIDQTIIEFIQRNVLTDAVVDRICNRLRDVLRDKVQAAPGQTLALQKEAKKLEREIANLTDAIASGGGLQPKALLEAINQKEARLITIRGELDVLGAMSQTADAQIKKLEQDGRERLARLRETFTADPIGARKAIETLLDGKFTITPIDGGKVRVEGDLVLPNLFFREESKNPGAATTPRFHSVSRPHGDLQQSDTGDPLRFRLRLEAA